MTVTWGDIFIILWIIRAQDFTLNTIYSTATAKLFLVLEYCRNWSGWIHILSPDPHPLAGSGHKKIFFLRHRFSFTTHEILLHYYTMIRKRIRIIVGKAGFKSGTSVPKVCCATNEPPHLNFYQICHNQHFQTIYWLIKKIYKQITVLSLFYHNSLPR